MSHVIITGGSSGIGKDLAALYVKNGDDITIIARCKVTLAKTESYLIDMKINEAQKILAISADVSNKDQINKGINQAVNEAGLPSILINSAGIAEPGYFQNLADECFERTMSINYFGTLYPILSCLPFMKQEGKGQIVLISSCAGLFGIFGYSAYSPSKFAVRGLGEVLRQELKTFNIGVSIVYPPDTNTPQLEKENKYKPKETFLISGTIKPWSSINVAKVIYTGITKNKFLISPGFQMKFLTRLHSLILPIINKFIDRKIKQ